MSRAWWLSADDGGGQWGVELEWRQVAAYKEIATELKDGELSYFYRLTPIAVIGGSFLPGLTGHNISEAAAAGCAVLTGRHLGHFAHMALEMQRLNPLSVLQVAKVLFGLGLSLFQG
ncbi:hypothetical protein RJ640_003166 [Escallonia rubra]|uniref:Uncharacterized protein n=1 Tax=Escallonia rubra TaxID=112253 RepID=A0AA88UJY2_9ASTE|nr:hypothetical protein RJ640_003166 [Escallonia rubra]